MTNETSKELSEALKKSVCELIDLERQSKAPPIPEVIHLPSSTLEFWKKSCLLFKAIAISLTIIPAIVMRLFPEILQFKQPLATFLSFIPIAGGIILGLLIYKAENLLGYWKYQRIDQTRLFSSYQWCYIS